MMTTNRALESRPTARHASEPERVGYRLLLRERISGELEGLSMQLTGSQPGPLASGTRGGRVALANVQGRIRWLGQLLAGLATPGDLHLDPDAAGFGSTVHVTDTDAGERLSFTLMTSTTVDVTGDQVSMDSPIGAALVGARPGDVVEAETPVGLRRFRLDRVATLLARFS